MQTTTTRPEHRGGHLSRHERQRQARAEAFSRRTPAVAPAASPVKLGREDRELIDRLVRGDRTVVSTALLAIAGIGAGEARRRSVLARVGEVARTTQAQGTISRDRGAQIARHVNAALGACDAPTPTAG